MTNVPLLFVHCLILVLAYYNPNTLWESRINTVSVFFHNILIMSIIINAFEGNVKDTLWAWVRCEFYFSCNKSDTKITIKILWTLRQWSGVIGALTLAATASTHGDQRHDPETVAKRYTLPPAGSHPSSIGGFWSFCIHQCVLTYVSAGL